MGGGEIKADRAEAIGLLKRALALMDARGFGIIAAPHVDLGLHLLTEEAARADDQASEAR